MTAADARFMREAIEIAHVGVRAAGRALNSHDLSGCTVYATGEPCPMCLTCCFWAHVPRIVFGSTLADSEAIGFGELVYAPTTLLSGAVRPMTVVGGVLREECLGIFKAWQSRGGRETY